MVAPQLLANHLHLPHPKESSVSCNAIDFHINNFTALSVGDILFVLSPPSGLVKLII